MQYYGERTFAWSGRQFLGAWSGPGYFYGYTYDDEGRRIKKTGEGFTTEYVYDGDRLLAETRDFHTIVYIYDTGNVPIGMMYRATDDTLWTNYWFEKNLQGDIIALWTDDGVKRLSYTYDAGGSCTQAILYRDGVGGYYYNNFRYRGYYMELDFGIYRTQTRIYDPYSGRFVSPDKYASTGTGLIGYNMYAYCNNNPANYVDPSGELFIDILAAAIVFVCLAATAHDAVQIAYIDETNDIKIKGDKNSGQSVELQNSYKIITPWGQWGYSFYLNHINEKTKDIIEGTTTGMQYEWTLHNVAYVGASIFGRKDKQDQAKSVAWEKTIFADDHDEASVVMWGTYFLRSPISFLIDIFAQ